MKTPDPEPGVTIASARRALAGMLRAHQIDDSPDLDARLLIGHALGLDHAAMAGAADRKLTPDEIAAIAELAVRRLGHEPVARIVGCKEFWGLPLKVTPAVLVPRPETETLVEAALAIVDAAGARQRGQRLADLGTGSGALLLALLTELPNASGIGTDRDARALAVAGANAQRLGLAERAHFVACDFGAALTGGFDLVVSNPPYIASAEIATLPPDVREYDPRAALDGGNDGLACYRAIAADAPRLLAPGGHIVVELGIGQAAPVEALLASAGLVAEHVRADLAGIPRALSATAPAAGTGQARARPGTKSRVRPIAPP
jgi:release factor glutamine methyltransferase